MFQTIYLKDFMYNIVSKSRIFYCQEIRIPPMRPVVLGNRNFIARSFDSPEFLSLNISGKKRFFKIIT